MIRHSLLLIFVPLLSLSGCLLVPFIDAFKQTGATEGDRMALLAPQVKNFTDAVGWGNRTKAANMALEETRRDVMKQLKSVGEDEHIVESKVEDIEWQESATKATVSVRVKYYMAPYYVVKNRLEEQRWEFALGSGWKLRDRTAVEE